MTFQETLRRQPQWVVLLGATALAGAIGGIDFVTTWEWPLSSFYLLPIVVVVLRSGKGLGYGCAVLCTALWSLSMVESNPYHSKLAFVLSALNHGIYFAAIVFGISAALEVHRADGARIAFLERAQFLEREILRTTEQEQQRIGRDLHDSLGPHLAAIGYAVSFLENELRKRDQSEVAATEKIGEMVKEALSLTRGLARGIFPVQMDGTGLAIALGDLAETVSRVSGMAISFCESGATFIGDPETGMHLYRIAQEAVNNASKHGEARNVSISLSTSDGSTRLIIADDGKGMSKLKSGAQGIGVQSMRYRARALQGQLKINSTPDEGTVVVCEVPDRPSMSIAPAL